MAAKRSSQAAGTRTRKAKVKPPNGAVSLTAVPIGAQSYDEILAMLPMALVVWRLDNLSDARSLRLVAINKEAGRIMHTTAEQAIGKPIVEMLPGIFDTNVPQIYAEVVRSGKPHDIDEIRYADAILQDAYYRVRVFPLADQRVGVAFEDISERKRAEEALRSSEAFLRMSQAVGNVGSWQWDLRTNQVRWSESMFTLYGLTTDQFDGTLSSAIGTTHPEDIPAVQETIRQLVEESIALPIEYRVIRSDGVIGHLWGLGEVIRDANGNATDVVGTVVDVTARKHAEAERQKLEAQVQQAQKLESLGILAGGIAHDFNNILTGILGYSDLAMQELPPDAPARRLIGEAAKGARRAADLTKQLLAYSGKGRFVLTVFNLNDVVKDMVPLLQISIHKKCALQYRFDPDLPNIEADASQVQQIVMNLIINAAEALGDQAGSITLTTGVMYCEQTSLLETFLHDNAPQGLYVYLEVVDTGCGMSDETRARIFEPFFTTKFTGRGLGLAAALGIVRGHRGLVQVRSELGKGTAFKIAFPATNLPPSLKSASGMRDSTWRRHGIILVVDDEESIRTLAKNMLERMGFAVLTAADGREALDIFAKQPNEIRLVLLDMTMPRLDGEETFRELRRIRNDVKAILSSGYDEQSATGRFFGKGLTGFLQKPYTYEQLMTVCRKAFGENE